MTTQIETSYDAINQASLTAEEGYRESSPPRAMHDSTEDYLETQLIASVVRHHEIIASLNSLKIKKNIASVM